MTTRPEQAGGDFTHSLDRALGQVSKVQDAADAQNQALVRGVHGASLEQAVVADAHARIAWNATVAVRNAVVNAYNTIMNMPI
jgi:flagellar hook-basal body complex protein FliE